MAREPWRLDLIRDYAGETERWGRRLDRFYPHEDMVWICYRALYIAAMTYQPSTCKFYSWLCRCRWTECNGVVKKHKRRKRGCRAPGVVKKGEPRRIYPPLRISTLNDDILDSRFYWLDKDQYA
jgi:hypothetical protein